MGSTEVDVLELLAGLVARSLVLVDDVPSEERRYRLLETIRQYAEEQLKAAEQTALRNRHARFYVDFVETAARGLRGPDQLRWLQQVEPELENLRTAMAWTVANDDALKAERFLVAAAEIERGPCSPPLVALRRRCVSDAERIDRPGLPVHADRRRDGGAFPRQLRPSRTALRTGSCRRRRARRRTRRPRSICARRRRPLSGRSRPRDRAPGARGAAHPRSRSARSARTHARRPGDVPARRGHVIGPG